MLKELTEDDVWGGWVFRTTLDRDSFLLSDWGSDLIADRTDHLQVLRGSSAEKCLNERVPA
jgi:hypothetical protein